MQPETVEHDPASPEPEVNRLALAEAKLRHYILGNAAPPHGITQGEALNALRTLALAVAFWRNWWTPIFCGGMALGLRLRWLPSSSLGARRDPISFRRLHHAHQRSDQPLHETF